MHIPLKRFPYHAFLVLAINGHPDLLAQSSGVIVDAVVNSASYLPSAPAQFGVGQGSLFLVYGTNLGPSALEQVSSFPLQIRLAGSSVRVTVAGTTVDAFMIYTASGILAAILPSRTPSGEGTLTVTHNGAVSNPVPIKVVPSAFGIYTVTRNGRGPAAVTYPNYQYNDAALAANPGETLTLWGTGLGAVSGDESAGVITGNRFPAAQVFVGAKLASVRYAGRSGCCAGIDQVAFDVPAGIEGCFVPLAVRVGGAISNFASISVTSQGRQCSDPAGIPSTAIAKASASGSLRLGTIGLGPESLLRSVESQFGVKDPAARLLMALVGGLPAGQDAATVIREAAKSDRARRAVRAYKQQRRQGKGGLNREALLRALADSESESLVAGFGALRDVSPFLGHLVSTISSVGSCSVLTCASPDCSLSAALPANRNISSPLDAGAELTLSAPSGARAIPKGALGFYRTIFPAPSPPGELVVRGSGGSDVGPFTARLPLAAPLTWTNKASISAVDRDRDLTVTWNASRATGYVVAGGLSGSNASGTFAFFICSEKAAAGSFTIPSFALSAMPTDAGSAPGGFPAAPGYLFLAVHPLANTFTAPGLDLGYFNDLSLDVKKVPYR